MDSRGTQCGYCKIVKGMMHFYHSDYDTGDTIRQLSECNDVLQEREPISTLRIEAPEFAPTFGTEEKKIGCRRDHKVEHHEEQCC